MCWSPPFVATTSTMPWRSNGWTARAWLAPRDTSLALLPMVIVGFLRLVTNRRVFIEPDSIEDAVTFVDALLDSPGVELQPCGEEWPILRAKLIARDYKGNEVTDAWIASATESSSEHLVTFDRDFLKLLSPGDFTLLTVETESD
jgi:uncharacterized protein